MASPALDQASRLGHRPADLECPGILHFGELPFDLVKLPLLVPSNHMGRLEDSFFIMTHVLCYAFMEAP